MALEKQIEVLESGLSANYHRVTHIEINLIDMLILIGVSVYASKQARDDGKKHLQSKMFRIKDPIVIQGIFTASADANKSIYQNIASICYEYIKTQEDFLEAVEV